MASDLGFPSRGFPNVSLKYGGLRRFYYSNTDLNVSLGMNSALDYGTKLQSFMRSFLF